MCFACAYLAHPVGWLLLCAYSLHAQRTHMCVLRGLLQVLPPPLLASRTAAAVMLLLVLLLLLMMSWLSWLMTLSWMRTCRCACVRACVSVCPCARLQVPCVHELCDTHATVAVCQQLSGKAQEQLCYACQLGCALKSPSSSSSSLDAGRARSDQCAVQDALQLDGDVGSGSGGLDGADSDLDDLDDYINKLAA